MRLSSPDQAHNVGGADAPQPPVPVAGPSRAAIPPHLIAQAAESLTQVTHFLFCGCLIIFTSRTLINLNYVVTYFII